MKFIIKRDVLLENLNYTSKALSSKNLIPVLSGIKFDLTEKGLSLSASDTDITIKTFIKKDQIISIDRIGSIVITGKYIVEIIRKLPNTDINIEVIDGFKMLISTENSEFSLNGIDPNEFPNLDLEENKEPILLNKKLFKTIINQTSFATSNQESRPLLTGINFKIEKNLLEVVATDSYRLAKKIINIDSNIENNINIVIPSRNLLELVKIINDENDNIELHIFTNKILFKYDNVLFQSRLLNGTYPVTSNLIPNTFNICMTTTLNGLYDVIDRAALLTSEKDKNIIKLENHESEVTVSSNSPEIGKVEEKIVVEIDHPEKIIISFSSKYMMDALRSFSTEKIKLLFINESSPIIIKSDEDPSLIQFILPIKTY